MSVIIEENRINNNILRMMRMIMSNNRVSNMILMIIMNQDR